MEEIILQMPWQCGDNDCKAPGGWHMASYWTHPPYYVPEEEGEDAPVASYTVDEFTDGDHEDIEEDDLPSVEKAEAAQDEYLRWVAEHGEDPLGQVYVAPRTPEERQWQLLFRRGIGHTYFFGGRPRARGPMLPPEELPEHVREYCEVTRLESHPRLWVFARSWTSLCGDLERNPDITVQHLPHNEQGLFRKILATIPNPRREPSTTAIKKAARAILKVRKDNPT